MEGVWLSKDSCHGCYSARTMPKPCPRVRQHLVLNLAISSANSGVAYLMPSHPPQPYVNCSQGLRRLQNLICWFRLVQMRRQI